MKNIILFLLLTLSSFVFSEEELYFNDNERDSIHNYCQTEAEMIIRIFFSRYKQGKSAAESYELVITSDLPDHLKLKALTMVERVYQMDFPKEDEKQMIVTKIGENMQYAACFKEKFKAYLVN